MKHIVIVDDSTLVLMLVTKTLEGAGFAVTGLTDPGQLKTNKDEPDLVLVDINMPQLRGDEVVQSLKLSESKLGAPVYLYSEVSEAELQQRAEECGADGYICKGWGLEHLVLCVEEVLGG